MSSDMRYGHAFPLITAARAQGQICHMAASARSLGDRSSRCIFACHIHISQRVLSSIETEGVMKHAAAVA